MELALQAIPLICIVTGLFCLSHYPVANKCFKTGPPVERTERVVPEPTFDDSDTDSDAEESGGRVRNDGTLLASDPPKPL